MNGRPKRYLRIRSVSVETLVLTGITVGSGDVQSVRRFVSICLPPILPQGVGVLTQHKAEKQLDSQVLKSVWRVLQRFGNSLIRKTVRQVRHKVCIKARPLRTRISIQQLLITFTGEQGESFQSYTYSVTKAGETLFVLESH